mgnify:CR=1 FL=1
MVRIFLEFFYLIVIFLWAAVFHLMDHELLKENPDKEYKELTHSLSGRNLQFRGRLFPMSPVAGSIQDVASRMRRK